MNIIFKLIKAIETNPSHTQRTLARELDVSLGKVNYLLSGLAEKGLIRARRLKNEPNKIRWNYILTPKGFREKAVITRDYLRRRVREFEEIRREIEELKKEVEKAPEESEALSG